MDEITQNKSLTQQLSSIVFDAYTVLNWCIGNPIDRDYAEFSLRNGGKYGLIAGGILVLGTLFPSCNLNSGDADNDDGFVPDTTPPAVTLQVDGNYLRGTGMDGSGVDISMFVDKNKNGIFEASEVVRTASADANETANIDEIIDSIVDLLPDTTYNAQVKGIDKSVAANENFADASFTTAPAPLDLDTTSPYSPTVSAESGITNGSISLDILINGDDISEQATQAVSGIASTDFYAMPINADFSLSDLETYGMHLGAYTEGAGVTLNETFTLGTANANYAIFSVSKDIAGNETLDFEDSVLSGGPTQLGHRFLGAIAGYTTGNVEIFGKVGTHQEKIGEYTPASDGTINLDVLEFVNGTTVALVYGGSEQEFTYQQGELDTVNF